MNFGKQPAPEAKNTSKPMKLSWFHRWLNQPKFSLKLFIIGLLPFFSGVVLSFIARIYAPSLLIYGWILIIFGVVIALPGYIGIWRWRWIQFKSK